MKNILAPTDFSTPSHNAIKYAISLAQSFDAAVILINVVPPSVMIDDSILASVMIIQAEILAENKKRWNRKLKRFQKNIQ